MKTCSCIRDALDVLSLFAIKLEILMPFSQCSAPGCQRCDCGPSVAEDGLLCDVTIHTRTLTFCFGDSIRTNKDWAPILYTLPHKVPNFFVQLYLFIMIIHQNKQMVSSSKCSHRYQNRSCSRSLGGMCMYKINKHSTWINSAYLFSLSHFSEPSSDAFCVSGVVVSA